MHNTEQQILSEISLVSPKPSNLKTMLRLADTDRLLSLSFKEGMAGLLYRAILNSNCIAYIPTEAFQRLEAHYYQTLRTNTVNIDALEITIKELKKSAISPVLLQGISLLLTVYNDIGIRNMGDMDLWILPEDFKDAANILEQLGYQAASDARLTFKKDEIILDVHTHIFWADRIKSRKNFIIKNQQWFYRRSEIITADNLAVRILNPFDQVLYLSLHTMKHNCGNLISLLDIIYIIKTWNDDHWQKFYDYSESLGLNKTIFHVFFLLKDVMNFCPKPVQNFLSRHHYNSLEKYLLRTRKRKGVLPAWAPIFLFLPNGSAASKIRYTFETLFPEDEMLKLKEAHCGWWQPYYHRLTALWEKLAPL